MRGGTAALVVVQERRELTVKELNSIFGTSEVTFDVGTEWVQHY